MAKIFGWAADNSGCGWYRMRVPLDELARRGHDTLVSVQMPDEWIDSADVIVGQRVCLYEPSMIWQRLAKHPNRPMLVFEMDDDLFDVPPSSEASYAFYSQAGVQTNLRRNIEVADVVTVSTEPLADLVRPINPNVRICPNTIPAALLELPAAERADERATIGWGGSSTHVMDFEDVGPQLVRFLKRNPAVAYHAIGGVFASMRSIPAGQVRITEWCDNIWDYYRALDFDVALAPLKPHVFNRSKSSVKALEAAARGIPIVASDVGPYPAFVRHGETGLIVSYAHEWPRALTDLVLDASMRAEMGAAARQLAAQHTIEANAYLWEDALLSELTTTSREAS